MKNFVRMSVLAAAAVALSACGSSGAKLKDKQAAAQAMYQATEGSGQSSGQSVVRGLVNRARALHAQAVASGAATVDTDLEITADCAHGGSATLKFNTDSSYATDTSVSIAYDISYDNCNEDGKNEIDGDMTMGIYLAADSSSFEAKFGLKGKIDIDGEISDSLDANITESVGINGTSGQVSLKIDGSIKTSDQSYTYSNETFTFSASAELAGAEEPKA